MARTIGLCWCYVIMQARANYTTKKSQLILDLSPLLSLPSSLSVHLPVGWIDCFSFVFFCFYYWGMGHDFGVGLNPAHAVFVICCMCPTPFRYRFVARTSSLHLKAFWRWRIDDFDFNRAVFTDYVCILTFGCSCCRARWIQSNAKLVRYFHNWNARFVSFAARVQMESRILVMERLPQEQRQHVVVVVGRNCLLPTWAGISRFNTLQAHALSHISPSSQQPW